MKNLILLVGLCALSLQAYSFEIQSKIRLSQDGSSIEKYLDITCNTKNSQQTFCNKLCAEPTRCEVPETLCEDCATQSSQTMHTIFTDVNSVFKADVMFADEQSILGLFQKRKFMSVPHDLFLNLFTPEKKALLKSEFEKLCYVKVESAVLLLSINEDKKADDVIGVICKDSLGSVILPMQLNPEFSNKTIDFWDKLNHEIGLRIENLNLKMTNTLNSTDQQNIKVDVKQ